MNESTLPPGTNPWGQHFILRGNDFLWISPGLMEPGDIDTAGMDDGAFADLVRCGQVSEVAQ